MGEKIETKDGVSKYFITIWTPEEEKDYEVPRELFYYIHNYFDYSRDVENKLNCLEEQGVDNWSGYSDAMDEYYRRRREEGEM